MITKSPYTLTQLVGILSALDNRRRNPCTKSAAIKAIKRKAEEIGLAAEDVFDAADLLLGGVMTAEDWRASLIDEASAEAEVHAETPEAEAPAEAEEAVDPATAAILELEEAEAQVDQEEPAQDDEPVDVRSEEFAATEAAQANEASWDKVAKNDRKTRENSKQARMIAMMRRPEGATVEQIAEEFGWQKHTVRGAISGALKKKLGLNITSGKIDGKRTYRIDD